MKKLDIKPILEKLTVYANKYKSLIILLAGIGFIVSTTFSTLSQLYPNRDETEFKSLQSEVVLTEFNQEAIDNIRNLKDYQANIDSQFINARCNPFEDVTSENCPELLEENQEEQN